MKTERELYEKLQNKSVLKRLVFIDSLNMYLTKDEYSDDDLTIQYCLEINHGWKMWQASANREGCKLVPVEAYGDILIINNLSIHINQTGSGRVFCDITIAGSLITQKNSIEDAVIFCKGYEHDTD